MIITSKTYASNKCGTTTIKMFNCVMGVISLNIRGMKSVKHVIKLVEEPSTKVVMINIKYGKVGFGDGSMHPSFICTDGVRNWLMHLTGSDKYSYDGKVYDVYPKKKGILKIVGIYSDDYVKDKSEYNNQYVSFQEYDESKMIFISDGDDDLKIELYYSIIKRFVYSNLDNPYIRSVGSLISSNEIKIDEVLERVSPNVRIDVNRLALRDSSEFINAYEKGLFDEIMDNQNYSGLDIKIFLKDLYE